MDGCYHYNHYGVDDTPGQVTPYLAAFLSTAVVPIAPIRVFALFMGAMVRRDCACVVYPGVCQVGCVCVVYPGVCQVGCVCVVYPSVCWCVLVC